MTFTQPEQRVRSGARRVRVERAVPMKAAAIIAALGIALIVTMGPAPASAQVTVVRECGDDYVVTRYNQDGTVKGVWNKQLSDEGTIYTAGKTWKLVEGNPDRFVSDGGAQLQVVACDATPGSGARGLGGVQQDGAQADQSSTTLVSNTGQSASPGVYAFNADVAQPFDTGSNSSGYTLTSVELNLKSTGTQATYSVAIHADSSGVPAAASLGTLTTTTTLTSSFQLVQFDASGSGINLDANKTYWVLVDVTTQSTTTEYRTTGSWGEDSGATGWTIGDGHRWRLVARQTWTGTSTQTGHDNNPMQIRVNGSANLPHTLPDNFDCNEYLGWEQTNPRFVYTGQYANTRGPICELRFSSAGPGSLSDKLGYGVTLCSQAPTWQTIDPETGEAVGGPDRKHYTGHKTLSGQDICSDFDGLRSTKKYIQEQQLKQLCSREPTHALCN